MRLGAKLGVYLAVVMSMVFWSLSFIWYRDANAYYGPITLVLLRLVVSSGLLFALMLLTGRLVRMARADVGWFMLLAFFEPFLYFMGESNGMTLISSTLAAVLISLAPLLSPIAERIFFGRRIGVLSVVGLVVSVLGVGVVVLHQGEGRMEADPYGVLLMLVAVLATAGYSVTVARLTARYDVFTIITYQNSIGALYFVPVFLLSELDGFMRVGITLQSAVPIVKLGVFASTFAFVLYTYAIKHLGITRASSFTNAIPVLTAILAYFMLGERLTPVMVLGIGVVMLGLFLSQRTG
ncbi:MAG: DMT family transporter [Bacteroidales bacterium]|nr:DMT family transporter [Bacteroidales bacterium]